MRDRIRALREMAIWLACGLVAAFLAMTGWGQPLLAAIASVPLTSSVSDPYARVVIGTASFVGLIWLMINFAELAVVLSLIQVRTALTSWWRYVYTARLERTGRIKIVPA